jgi:hypothetical protein
MTNEFKKQIISYILGAFGLVAGLAWNDAIKSLIEFIFPLEQNSLTIKFIYAAVLTLILVLVSTNLSRFGEKKEK